MSLALVLVLVVVFGLLVPVLAQLGAASGVSTRVTRDRRLDELAAENAIQAAIAAARVDPTVGRESVDACPVRTDENNGRSVRVTCAALEGSGRVREARNAPAYALLSMGVGDAETGIVLDGGGTVRTGGPLWSNSSPAIALRGGVRLDAHGDLVGGAGGCPAIDASPRLCETRVEVGDPAVANPGRWPSAVTAFDALTYRPVPADPCGDVPPSRVYALAPGYYRDLPGLNRLARGECGPVVLWLQPGAFSVDFDFFDPARTTWQLTDAVVVGGVPSGWDPGAATSQVAAVRARIDGGGSCDRARDGVELAFGGASRVDLLAPGALELCPVEHRDDDEAGQALAITGRTTGPPPQTTVFATDPVAATASVTGGTFTWPGTLPAGPLVSDDCPDGGPCPPGSSVAADLAGPGARGTVTMTVPYPVPAGVRLDELQVVLVHREAGALSDLRLDVDGLPAGVTCDPDPVDRRGEWRRHTTTCAIDLAPTTVAPGSTITLTLTATNGADPNAASTIELDQVQLAGKYTLPDLRAQSGCVVEPGGCPFVDVRGGATIAVHGTVHAPLARITADFGGRAAFRFTRGAVLRSFRGDNAPDDPRFTPFRLPAAPLGPYADRFVVLEAAIDGEVVLTARVYLCESLDPDAGWNPRCRARPPQAPRITTWTVSR
jgi:hypothetical protein